MAKLTLLEIYNARFENTDLRKKVIAAITVSADKTISDPLSAAASIEWANNALINPIGEANKMYSSLLLDPSISDASKATDNEIQLVINKLAARASISK